MVDSTGDHANPCRTGFIRKEGRRQIARLALERGLVPENFWDAVDDLAGQTVLVFQPLFMLMTLGRRRTVGHDGPVFWQEVHTILAMAGYFQVCMAVSPSIFHVLSASPGARFQWGEEAHADQDIYEASKAFHGSHNTRWAILARHSADNKSDSANRLLKSVEDPLAVSGYMPLPRSDGEYRSMDHQRRRGGKVMYAVFPKLTRYAAENVGQTFPSDRRATSQALREGGEGMRIKILSKCMVVYYQGLVHSPADQTDGVPLDDHLEKIARARMGWGVLPYFQHYWDADGTAASLLRWPLWPENVDVFWLFWLLDIFVTSILRWTHGPPPPIDQRSLWATLLFRPFVTHLLDVAVYLAFRIAGLDFINGRYVYWKFQGVIIAVNLLSSVLELLSGGKIRLFSYLVPPLIWLDQALLDTLPKFALAASRVIRVEGTSNLVSRTVAAITAGNGTAGN